MKPRHSVRAARRACMIAACATLGLVPAPAALAAPATGDTHHVTVSQPTSSAGIPSCLILPVLGTVCIPGL